MSETLKTILLTRRFLQNSDNNLVENIVQRTSAQRIFDPHFTQAHFRSATFVTVLFGYFFIRHGVKHMEKLAPYIVGSVLTSQLAILFLLCYNNQFNYDLYFKVIGYGMEDFKRLMHFGTWYVALLTSMVCFSTGDGKLYGLGSLNRLNNNLFTDLWIQKLSGLVFYMFLSMPLGMVVITGQQLGHGIQETRELNFTELRGLLLNEATIFNNIYYFSTGPFTSAIFAVVCLTFLMWQLGNLIIPFEQWLLMIYRSARIFRLYSDKFVRSIVAAVYLLLILLIHVFSPSFTPAMVTYAMPSVVFAELMSAFVLGPKRFMIVNYTLQNINLYMVVRRHRYWFLLIYTALLPLIFLLIIIRQMLITFPIEFYFIPSALLGFCAFELCTKLFQGRTNKLDEPTNSWEPHTAFDKQTYTVFKKAVL